MAWLEMMDTMRAEEERAAALRQREQFHEELRAVEQKLKEGVASGAAHRWSQRGVSKCLVSWQAWAMEKVTVRSMVQQMIGRMQHVRAPRVAADHLAERREGCRRRSPTKYARHA